MGPNKSITLMQVIGRQELAYTSFNNEYKSVQAFHMYQMNKKLYEICHLEFSVSPLI